MPFAAASTAGRAPPAPAGVSALPRRVRQIEAKGLDHLCDASGDDSRAA